jgi:hypothetical protein
VKTTNSMNAKFSQLLKHSATVLTVLVALLALGTSTAAVAQSSFGPEGSWLYTVTIPGSAPFEGIETYSAGEGYSEADQLSFSPLSVASAGHGAWKMTGERTFLLTYLNLTFDSFSSGTPTGTLKVRQTTKLDTSDNYYTGSGNYAYYNPDGSPILSPGYSDTFTITAKRIVVQAPK